MSGQDIQPGLEWVVDLMRPEEAEGVARLFREVYGEGYPVRTFIDPDRLRAENQAQRVISSVARTTAGDIVGHNALFHSAPTPRIFESGAGLVHRHYRGGHGIFGQLYIHGQNVAAEMGVDAIWGEPVTNHTFAQKMTYSYGARLFAVEADLMPAAAYTKEASAQGRVSTFMCFFVFRPSLQRVYVPAVYKSQLEFMYGELLPHRELATPPPGRPEEGETALEPEFFDFAAVVRIAVNRIGRDFSPTLADTEAESVRQGVQVIQVWLRLNDPGVGHAVESLRSRGYFLGGPLPHWFGDDGLLMQKTLEPPLWDSIQTASQRNDHLVSLVRRDWREVAG